MFPLSLKQKSPQILFPFSEANKILFLFSLEQKSESILFLFSLKQKSESILFLFSLKQKSESILFSFSLKQKAKIEAKQMTANTCVNSGKQIFGERKKIFFVSLSATEIRGPSSVAVVNLQDLQRR